LWSTEHAWRFVEGERVGSFASLPKMRAVREGRDVLSEHVPDQLRGGIFFK
jgi:hypothetical protein